MYGLYESKRPYGTFSATRRWKYPTAAPRRSSLRRKSSACPQGKTVSGIQSPGRPHIFRVCSALSVARGTLLASSSSRRAAAAEVEADVTRA